ncbi:MAG: hypothetical protein ABIJ46_00350 [bacterium]
MYKNFPEGQPKPAIREEGGPEKQDSQQETDSQFLSAEEIEELVRQKEKDIRASGLVDAHPSGSPYVNADGVVFALPFECYRQQTGADEKVMVTVSMDGDRMLYLLNGDVRRPLAESELPQAMQEEFLLEMSRSSKVVKSRPMFMYPDLFDLPREEVWPKGADITVIGDPYQLCDREGVTIVEYEYADEIMPSILLDAIRREEVPNDGWYEDLYHEDLRALDTMYGQYTPTSGNPYLATVHDGLNLMSRISETLSLDRPTDQKTLDDWQSELERLQELIGRLVDGSWSIEDFAELQESYQEDFMTFFDYKQESLDALGDPKKWNEYLNRWERYLSGLPNDRLRREMDGYDKKIEQARHWMSVLPTSKSPSRAASGLQWMENLYHEIASYAETGDHNDPLIDTEISDALSNGLMADGAFGYFVPGYPISARNRRFLETVNRQAGNMLDYANYIWPQLSTEANRLKTDDVELNEQTLFAYLRPTEQGLIRERYFKKHAQKSVPLHGFFPYRCSFDPQDRILALTSVTMHGWNSLDQKGFRDDLEAALPFLKVGGKYILGPINQRVYFGGVDEGFDANGLTQVLKTMHGEGKIDYRFVKGQRQYEDSWREEPEYGPEDELLPGESAASLVITRLA